MRYVAKHVEWEGKRVLCICALDLEVDMDVAVNNFSHRKGEILAIAGNSDSSYAWVELENGSYLTFAFDQLEHVVGPVSKQATWVEEGKIFETKCDIENAIAFGVGLKILYKKQHKCNCEKPDMYRSPEQAKCEYMVDDNRGGDLCINEITVVDCVQVLGPCGHFH